MTTRFRALATGAIGIALATTLSTAVPAAAAGECDAGQLCVWIYNPSVDNTYRSVVTPDAYPDCTSIGFGMFHPVAAVNNTASDVVFYDSYSCTGPSTTVPAGGEVNGFGHFAHSVTAV